MSRQTSPDVPSGLSVGKRLFDDHRLLHLIGFWDFSSWALSLDVEFRCRDFSGFTG